MRDIEKAMHQMERDESRHARGLTSPSGRTDSGRTTPTGRLTPPGSTGSGLTTPTGRVTPPGITSSVGASGRVSPPSTTRSGITTLTGRVTPPGTSGSGRLTPTGRGAVLTRMVSNPQGHTVADAGVLTNPDGRVGSGLTTPTDSVTPSGLSYMTDYHNADSRLANRSVTVNDSLATTSQAATAVAPAAPMGQLGPASGGSLATAVAPTASPAALLSTRSNVKDAVAMYEGSHPSSSRLTPSRSTVVQQSMSLSGGAYSRLASSKSSVAYQTKSLSEGVYGKLYSSKSSLGQEAISASWDAEIEEAEESPAIRSSAAVAGPSDGASVAGGGSAVAAGVGATSSGGIGRFGGGIGRGGTSKLAVEVKPAASTAADGAADESPGSDR